MKSNWLHIFIEDKMIANSLAASEAIQEFNKTASGQQIHISLSSFLCLSVFFRVIIDWVKIIARGISLQPQVKKLEHTKLYWPLIENDWKNSLYGISAIRNVLFFNLFEEAFEYLKTQKVCIYLMENQGWEIGLLQAWKSKGHRKIIGFPHTTIRFWDLVYFSVMGDERLDWRSSKPTPDLIACNGDFL